MTKSIAAIWAKAVSSSSRGFMVLSKYISDPNLLLKLFISFWHSPYCKFTQKVHLWAIQIERSFGTFAARDALYLLAIIHNYKYMHKRLDIIHRIIKQK